MGSDAISRAEHEEFKHRIEDEDSRQNHRLATLEEKVDKIHTLAVSVEKLALSVHGMVEEQKKYNTRLETLENRDGELWRKIVGYVLTAGAGFIFAALLRKAGIF